MITDPITNSAPVTPRVKFPVLRADGVIEAMLGAARIVTDAVALAVGTATLVARTVTTRGLGGADGGRYCPPPSIVPTTGSPLTISLTLHVTPAAAPVTVALNDWK